MDDPEKKPKRRKGKGKEKPKNTSPDVHSTPEDEQEQEEKVVEQEKEEEDKEEKEEEEGKEVVWVRLNIRAQRWISDPFLVQSNRLRAILKEWTIWDPWEDYVADYILTSM